MAQKKESRKEETRVWIEWERPATKEKGEKRAALVTAMLRRLGVEHQRVWWSGHEGRYCYGDDMGYIVLADTGHWFNLDYFGREQTDTEKDAQDFAALQAKMVDCGWGDDPDGTVKHERLGMQHPSWIDAMTACIEVASEV